MASSGYFSISYSLILQNILLCLINCQVHRNIILDKYIHHNQLKQDSTKTNSRPGIEVNVGQLPENHSNVERVFLISSDE